MRQFEPSPEITEQLNGEAHTALDEAFASFVQRRSAARPRDPERQRLTEALLRPASRDEAFQKIYQRDPRSPAEQLEALRRQESFQALGQLMESPAAQAFATQPLRDLNVPWAFRAPDRQLQLLGPPYTDVWLSQHQAGNATVQNLSANRATGEMGFFLGSADGAASCGTGLWTQFIPTRVTQAQARAYMPFNYQYDLNSQWGYTAHVQGGFGVYVLSWRLDGTQRTPELNYRYPAWSDGTGWWDHHNNPSFPDHDFDYAYLYGRESPYFNVRPDRVYKVCFWSFCSSDAGGGYFGNAISAAALNAAVRFVVIGEQ